MIPLTIALSAAGVVIALLAIIATVAIQESRRQARLKNAAYKEQARAMEEISTLREEDADLSESLETTKALYNKMLRERNELVARSTALQEAMEARPTQPTKRAVPKRGTQATEQ